MFIKSDSFVEYQEPTMVPEILLLYDRPVPIDHLLAPGESCCATYNAVIFDGIFFGQLRPK